MNIGTTIELRRGPGDGERHKVKLSDFLRTKSGIWCVTVKLVQHNDRVAMYSTGAEDPRMFSPIQVYDALWVGWVGEFTITPPPQSMDEVDDGC